MYPLLLIRYGELSLKGKNRRVFENILLENIRKNLESVEHGPLTQTFGRIYLATNGNWRELAERLQSVFGIVSVSPVLKRDLDLDDIKAGAVALGAGSSLTGGAKTGDYAKITETAKQFIQKIKEARGK